MSISIVSPAGIKIQDIPIEETHRVYSDLIPYLDFSKFANDIYPGKILWHECDIYFSLRIKFFVWGEGVSEVDAEDEDSDECEEEGDEGDQEADGEDEGGDDEEGARRRSDTAAAAAAGDRAEGGEAEISDDANGERTDDEGSAASDARLDLEDDRGDGAVRARVAQRSCRRHTAADYRSHRVRTRFAFLFAGYATDRSGLVVAWEMFVMLQKLAVTLAGSSVTDVRCSARAPPPARAPSLVLTLLLCLPTLVLSFAPPCTAFVLRSRTSRF